MVWGVSHATGVHGVGLSCRGHFSVAKTPNSVKILPLDVEGDVTVTLDGEQSSSASLRLALSKNRSSLSSPELARSAALESCSLDVTPTLNFTGTGLASKALAFLAPNISKLLSGPGPLFRLCVCHAPMPSPDGPSSTHPTAVQSPIVNPRARPQAHPPCPARRSLCRFLALCPLVWLQVA